MTLPIFYFPSTIAWIDDDRLFLKAAAKIFCTDHTVKTFNNPLECKKYFNNQSSQLSETSFLRGYNEHEYYDTANHALVNCDVPALHELQKDPHKNKLISVLIADYNMPGMNGIELCQQLKNTPIKKILLTGEPELCNVIAAFNDNIIDRFIRKDSPTLTEEIQNHIYTLTHEYFCSFTRGILTHLEVDYRLPLSDPIFVKFFQQWCDRYEINEYYLIDKHGSLMGKSKQGTFFYLILHTDRSLKAFTELHDDVKDAEALLHSITQRKKIPFFGIGRESWEFEARAWGQYLYDPAVLLGREKYYWTTIESLAK